MAAVQGLEYIIRLTDQLSAPLRGVMKSIDDLGKRGEDAMKKIGIGAAGLYGTGAALKSALDPAIDFSRAMNEVKAAGVGASGLAKIQDFALDFSSTFGIASTDVVNSVNEIARAINGLTDDELISFSRGSNLLAKATGSNVAEMGSYLSTMYGIFQQEADRMGKSQWIEQMAGQATLTANMFKSSGESLSQAFTNLMSTGQSKGVELAEQFAVLGNLQSVMPGGQSGTKYAAFLNGVGKASSKLGLSFLDANNRMKPITEVLAQIKGKYGDVIDEIEAQSLAKAFGTTDAVQVINYLLPKIDSLKDNIAEIGSINTLNDAAKVAKITTDAWMRFVAIFQNIKIAIGTPILKKLEPILNYVADIGQEFQKWLSTYKNIARWIGYAVGAFIGFGGVAATLTLISGIVGAIGIGLAFLASPIMAVIGVLTGLGVLMYKYKEQAFEFIQGFVAGWKLAAVSFDPLIRAAGIVWEAFGKIGVGLARIMGAFSGSADGAYSFKQAGIDVGYAVSTVFNIILGAIELIARGFGFIADVFSITVNAILDGWTAVTTLWDSNAPLESFLNIANALSNIFLDAFRGIVNSFTSVLNFIIEKANTLPGINIPLIPKWEDSTALGAGAPLLTAANGEAGAIAQRPLLSAVNLATQATSQISAPLVAQSTPAFSLGESAKPQFATMPRGGISKVMTQQTQNVNKTINWGGVTINGSDGREIMQEMRNREQLAAG